MEQDQFVIRAYSKGVLSQMYNPQITYNCALRLFNKWINRNPALTQALAPLGYDRSVRALSPQMVRVIVEHLGEP